MTTSVTYACGLGLSSHASKLLTCVAMCSMHRYRELCTITYDSTIPVV